MKHKDRSITILIAEDDPDDRVLVEEAFQECGLDYDLFFVEDGLKLVQFLRQEGSYATPASAPRPDLILLDLYMPLKDGREALAEIKADPNLRYIPVVVLTNSISEADVLRTYDQGGSGFIIKPVSFQGMVEIVRVINEYWFEVVELSNGEGVKRVNHKNPTVYSSG